MLKEFRLRAALALTLAACLSLPSFAEPPKLKMPADTKATSGYVTIKPETNCATVTYIGLSGVDPFPSEELRDPTKFLLPVSGLARDKVYTFAAVGAINNEGKVEQVTAVFTVTVGTPTTTTPPTKPGEPVPGDPGTPTPGEFSYYFYLVRSDQPVDAGLDAVMKLSGWKELEAAGHAWKDIPLSMVPADYSTAIPSGSTIPAILKIKVAKNAAGKPVGKVDGPLIKFPAGGVTNDWIKSLYAK